jgi:C-terminal processing protease CtpA/Prc
VRTPAAVILSLSLSTAAFAAETPPTPQQFQQDFEFLCSEVGSNYAYFDTKATRWNDVPGLYRDDLKRVTTRTQFVSLLEGVVDEIYDPHSQLNSNTPASFRLVPSGTDLWAEWHAGKAVITQVRGGSDAERAGLVADTVVLTINDKPVDAAVDARLGRSYPHATPGARDWALRSVLAGVHETARVLKVQSNGATRAVTLPAKDQFHRPPDPITHSEIRPGVGYILLNDSLGNNDTVAAFDNALASLRSTKALIVDLRNTASGGDSSVARGILGRFVARELPYQKHILPSEEHETGVRRSWLELVTPRGDFRYEHPVAVLVNRWTGSMGEGLAIGFDATGAGKLVGTAMAQLVGATYTITLPNTGLHVNVPAERLEHVNGTPREKFLPPVLVDVSKASAANDPFITAALTTLGR